jgi:hypothetical protein
MSESKQKDSLISVNTTDTLSSESQRLKSKAKFSKILKGK